MASALPWCPSPRPPCRSRQPSTVCSASARRAIVVLPGLGNNSEDYGPLAEALRARGLVVEVAPVRRLDWARNASGLRHSAYWRGTLQPRPTVDWYLERVGAAAGAARSAAGDAPLTLLAHSAGGWLGRLFMLEDRAGVDRFVSLGSPHLPPPPGVVDQTRGILTWVSNACPGAFHSDVKYVTVAGKYLQGAPLLGPGAWQQRIVGAGYQQVCGDAEVWGDGVVPVPSAHLEGATNITLEGVYHSPLGADPSPGPSSSVEGQAERAIGVGGQVVSAGAGEGAGGAQSASPEDAAPGRGRLWYGSPGVLEQWVEFLSDPAAARVR